jgi:hypothetical protein
MRRKIEKYLAQKAGVDESQIIPTDDGRYDFASDFEGVLAAVRGTDGHSGNLRGASRILHSGNRSSRSSLSSTKSSMHDSSHRKNVPPLGYMYHQYPPPPFNHNMFYGHPPPHVPMGKENMNNIFMPPYWPLPPPVAPSGVASKPPASHFLRSTEKSIYDSPPKDDALVYEPRPDATLTPTAPLSNLKDTFATPLASNSEAHFTIEDAMDLNKTLFSEAVMTTPFFGEASMLDPIRISIGNDAKLKDYRQEGMKLNNRVTISPMSRDARKTLNNLFNEGDEELSKCVLKNLHASSDDKERMPPPTAPRAEKATTTPLPTHNNLTPFDSCHMVKQLTTTPSTAATAPLEETSFWNDDYHDGMSPVPSPHLSSPPFHSPNPVVFLTNSKVPRVDFDDASNHKRRRNGNDQ